MLLSKFVFGAWSLTGLGKWRMWRGLHSTDKMRAILQRESARSDRSGDIFSLLVFDPGPAAAATMNSPHPAHLARVLVQRVRSTDEVGRLNGQLLAAVLPCTPAEGAWKLAEDVCRLLPPRHPAPKCKVYCYPSDWPSEGDGNGETSDRRQASGGGRPAHAMEMLFFQRMPPWKRFLDITGSAIGLVLLAPLFAMVAVAVKLSSPGPVFFRQYRSGRGGRPFVMYKFRSMVADAEARKNDLLELNERDGPAFKLTDDPRVTRLGRFLRRTSIDELPQLWNVLKGQMSLVGPRPLPCAESDVCRGWQRRRLDVVPGLTCIWQLRGRSQASFADWVRMDLQYIRSIRLTRDLKILLRTVPAVLSGRGAK